MISMKKLLLWRMDFVDSTLAIKNFDERLSILDDLPDVLYGPVVTHSFGDLATRANSVLSMRDNLIKGELPAIDKPWPELELQQLIVQDIQRFNIIKYCYKNESLVDELLLELLSWLESVSEKKERLLLKNIKDQEKLELTELRSRSSTSSSSNTAFGLNLDSGITGNGMKIRTSTKKNKFALPTELTIEKKDAIRVACEESIMNEVISELGINDGILDVKWKEYTEIWAQLESLFKDLSLVTDMGFDFSQGFFQSHGWLDLVKLNAVIENIPQLKEVINTLGRMKVTEDEPIIEIITERIRKDVLVNVPVVTPLAPMETKGVTRSGDINRMLPQESAMLGHPVLKSLWHARRAEEALCTYAVEGTIDMALEGEIEVEQDKETEGSKQNKNMGPMIICLDTSGSMQGLPENIAKAIVLECLKVATRQKRQCLVYTFGGPGEIAEFELEASAKSIQKIISFLSMSFSGGTDVDGPLNKALDHCKKNDWQKADIMLVSDGAFHADTGLKNRITRRKKDSGLTVHGVVVGGNIREFKAVCDPLHHFNEWEHMAAFEEYR